MSRFSVMVLLLSLPPLLSALPGVAAQTIVVRNNHDMPYSGPITCRASLPDGFYAGKNASGRVSEGTVRIVAKLAAQSQVELTRVPPKPPAAGPLSVSASGGATRILWSGKEIGSLDLGLVVAPGRKATADDAVSKFRPLDMALTKRSDGTFSGIAQTDGYGVTLTLRPVAGGWVDAEAEVVRQSPSADATYIALVRRVTSPGAGDVRMRWNGRVLDGDVEPTEFVGSFAYTRCLDWCSWRAGEVSFVVANGFTPGFTIEQSPGKWVAANHYYAWEHVRRQGDALYFVSEIAGPDPALKADYVGAKAYTPPVAGEPVKVHWRLAVAPKPEPTWQESQFLVSSGYRGVSASDKAVTVDLGAPYVEFGTSYFPYSTMTENFNYYRTPGLDREGWWPFSPTMWERWREFAPQMQTDLRIIRAMGIERVRLHHLEIASTMDRKNLMDFIDFYMDECRKLKLRVLIDTSGTPQWFTTLAGRYKDIADRIEIENEVLIPGIRPGDAERWTACYKAAKAAAPDTDVFLTGNANVGMFDRLTRLGVPYDKLGWHGYKHGPGGEETLSSQSAGMAGVAADKGTTPVLGEFNWKKMTQFSPEARAKEWALIFNSLLSSRSVPELLQFHWQETACVNPELCRQGIRHYETIYLDRRPKPEAIEFMKLIRENCRPDATVRELPIKVVSTQFANGKAVAEFELANATKKTIAVKLAPESFGDTTCALTSAGSISLKPGQTAKATVEVALKPNALPGVYHFFLKADYAGKTAYGWGYASNVGDAIVDAKPVLPEKLVDYPESIATSAVPVWSRADCVAFGPDCPILELEMAYLTANTLQSATGRSIRLCSTADIPEDMLKTGNLILVGTAKSNPLIASKASMLSLPEGKGAVRSLNTSDGFIAGSWLVLTGSTTKEVEAASIDFVLRYWKNAKDAAVRITGMEEGAALGHRVNLGQINPP